MVIQWSIAVPVLLMATLLAYISAPSSPPLFHHHHHHHQTICSSSSASNVTSIFVFGDDTVDAGSIGFPLSKHYGNINSQKLWRMSDGRSLADLVAEHFHLPYIPAHFDNNTKYTEYGVNFASFGCGIDKNTKAHPDLNCKPLSSQVEAFNEYVKSYSKIDLDKSIALISIGQNDILFPQKGCVDSPLDNLFEDLKSNIKNLVIGGLKNILITNMPPLGCYPAVRLLKSSSHECDNETNCIVNNYNAKLFDMVEELKHPTRGFGKHLSIRFVDMHSVVQEVTARPSTVGIKNVEHSCCEIVDDGCEDFSNICEDKTDFVYFDNFHLTERMYEVIFLHMKLFAPLH